MFGFLKRIRRDDPIFGSMLYMGDKAGYWEAKTRFRPTGENIELFVDGRSDDSMVFQHEFFETICRRWSEIAPTVISKCGTYDREAVKVS
jgi:hypothetical protein